MCVRERERERERDPHQHVPANQHEPNRQSVLILFLQPLMKRQSGVLFSSLQALTPPSRHPHPCPHSTTSGEKKKADLLTGFPGARLHNKERADYSR